MKLNNVRVRNKEKQKEWSRKHYLTNRDKIIRKAKDHNKRAIKEAKDYIRNYLLEHPCVDCGEIDIVVLEFDHVRGIKKHNISNMKHASYCIVSIKEEIDKCEVRCCNCHRRVTNTRRLNKS